jgi:hypothetical protein
MKRGDAPKEILYVSDARYGVVNVYDAQSRNPAPLGQLAGLAKPEGLYVDAVQELWVADMDHRALVVYPKGGLFPVLSIDDTSGYPHDICAGPSFKITVVDRYSADHRAGKTISIYTSSKEPPKVLTDQNSEGLLSCAVDAQDDVFVSMIAGRGSEIDEFPKGKTEPVPIATNLKYAGGLAFDANDNLVVCDALAQTVYVYAPPYDGGPASKFHVDGIDYQIAFDRTGTHLWLADGLGAVAREYSYPEGKPENKTSFKGLNEPEGVALSPPSI